MIHPRQCTHCGYGSAPGQSRQIDDGNNIVTQFVWICPRCNQVIAKYNDKITPKVKK